MATGTDISEHQGNLSPDWFNQWDFAIIRAHSGFRKDHKFDQNWNNARGRTLRGVYGYLEPGRDARQQARELVQFVGDDKPELLYWSDAEAAGTNVEQVLAHLDELAKAGPTGFYSYVPFLGGPLGNDRRLQNYPLWIAGYGRNDGNRYPLNPGPPWGWVIHQYTSRGGPGGTGLDVNYAPSLDFAGATAPAPKLEVPEMYIAVGQTIYGVPLAVLVNGPAKPRIFNGAPGAYGIPADALAWKQGAGREAVQYIFVEPAEIHALYDVVDNWGKTGGASTPAPAPAEPVPYRIQLEGTATPLE